MLFFSYDYCALVHSKLHSLRVLKSTRSTLYSLQSTQLHFVRVQYFSSKIMLPMWPKFTSKMPPLLNSRVAYFVETSILSVRRCFTMMLHMSQYKHNHTHTHRPNYRWFIIINFSLLCDQFIRIQIPDVRLIYHVVADCIRGSVDFTSIPLQDFISIECLLYHTIIIPYLVNEISMRMLSQTLARYVQ